MNNWFTYICWFTGCQKGAIGVHHPMKKIFNSQQALSLEQVKMKLYETHEHISKLVVNEEQWDKNGMICQFELT